jgi:putative CocE/NonD family hydrolase
MGSRYLKAIVPRVMGDNLHRTPHYQDGAFQLALNATWSFRMWGRTMQDIDKHNWDQLFPTLPLKDLPKAGGKDIPYFRDWLSHPDYDDYWKNLAIKERFEDIVIPVLQIGGWYDTFTAGTFRNFVGVRERSGSKLARGNQRAIVGPWVHPASTMTHAGEVDFGKGSVLDLHTDELRWFDHWLKGISNGVEEDAPLRIFVMGTNQWRDEHEWPLARTRFTPYYLHSGGSANSLLGDGELSTRAPGEEPADGFTYNPAFPTPTRGGNNCCNPEIVPWGAYDQRSVELRSDVLVYTSAPLEEDLEVTGPVIAKVFASTDGRDTDFTAKLVDVHPDGYAVNLCDGIIRGRYRESTSTQKLLEPGAVYEFTIDLWPTSNVFLRGHRIRLDIASANFPRFDRNPNTGNAFAEDAELREAHQGVYHDGARASHVLLPVIPRGQ